MNKLIDKGKLIRDLTVLQPYNNSDVPAWVWNVINGQPEVSNAAVTPNNKIELGEQNDRLN